MMKRICFLAAVVPLLWASTGLAAQSQQTETYGPGVSNASEGHRITDIGQTAKADLELQRSGRAAVDDKPLSQAAATRIYDRYLDSFTHEIPEKFEESSFSPSGGSGG